MRKTGDIYGELSAGSGAPAQKRNACGVRLRISRLHDGEAAVNAGGRVKQRQ